MNERNLNRGEGKPEQANLEPVAKRLLNKIIGRALEQVTVEQDKAETSIRQEIKASMHGEPSAK